MDHGFNDRVDKVFGSISSSSSAPWSLTDAPVERRSWNRDKGDGRNDDETLVSSSFDDLLNSQRDRLDDADWDIRSSIGLDPTLDNEEEEDAYDKMAQGMENGGDRVYMKDVTDHGPYLNSHNVLPSSVHHVENDLHDAAKTRLKEEEEDDDEEEAMLIAPAADDNGGKRIKSILKRKSENEVAKVKRVRFDPSCKTDDGLTNVHVPQAQGSGPGLSVPDYIQNPCNYTRYDLSHDDLNERSNSEAYMEFLSLRKSKHDDVGVDHKSSSSSSTSAAAAVLPGSVVFIPRKKRGDAVCNSDKQLSSSTGIGIAISDVEVGGENSDEMQQQDEVSHLKPTPAHRRYRSRLDQDDHNVC